MQENQYCQRLAKEKSIAQKFDNALVLAADTIVAKGNMVSEKPIDDEDAMQQPRESSPWGAGAEVQALRLELDATLCDERHLVDEPDRARRVRAISRPSYACSNRGHSRKGGRAEDA